MKMKTSFHRGPSRGIAKTYFLTNNLRKASASHFCEDPVGIHQDPEQYVDGYGSGLGFFINCGVLYDTVLRLNLVVYNRNE